MIETTPTREQPPHRTYRWEGRRPGRRVHVLNPETGRVWCKLENMQRKRAFDSEGPEKPPGRKVCSNCLGLIEQNKTNFQEPNIKVLLGERLAGVELDLFADAPGSRKSERPVPKCRNTNRDASRFACQVRTVHRPKERKPKGGKVRHPRPFNDDLPPWL